MRGSSTPSSRERTTRSWSGYDVDLESRSIEASCRVARTGPNHVCATPISFCRERLSRPCLATRPPFFNSGGATPSVRVWRRLRAFRSPIRRAATGTCSALGSFVVSRVRKPSPPTGLEITRSSSCCPVAGRRSVERGAGAARFRGSTATGMSICVPRASPGPWSSHTRRGGLDRTSAEPPGLPLEVVAGGFAAAKGRVSRGDDARVGRVRPLALAARGAHRPLSSYEVNCRPAHWVLARARRVLLGRRPGCLRGGSGGTSRRRRRIGHRGEIGRPGGSGWGADGGAELASGAVGVGRSREPAARAGGPGDHDHRRAGGEAGGRRRAGERAAAGRVARAGSQSA